MIPTTVPCEVIREGLNVSELRTSTLGATMMLKKPHGGAYLPLLGFVGDFTGATLSFAPENFPLRNFLHGQAFGHACICGKGGFRHFLF